VDLDIASVSSLTGPAAAAAAAVLMTLTGTHVPGSPIESKTLSFIKHWLMFYVNKFID